MRKLILLLWLAFLSFGLSAGIVDTSTARLVAQNFILSKYPNAKGISLQLATRGKSADYPFYIFNFSNGRGFVIVSSQYELYPILAYSDESSFDLNTTIPEVVKGWLDSTRSITLAARQGKIKQHPMLKILWQQYISGQLPLKKSYKSTGPLLSTKWNQGKYYNAMCPADPAGEDGHVWTGCVATAMAQVLKYWGYPVFGNGDHSYDHNNYGHQYADFAHTHYYWDSMPNTLSTYNHQVAQLMYHCGVAVNMNYSTSGSGAYMTSARYAMINYFDYSRTATLRYKNSSNEWQWDSLIMDQINHLRPVLYAGYGSGGHAFVIDGYNATDTTFHVNWGWGGSYNGWYRLDDLTPGSSSFNNSQEAIINLYPETGDTTYTVITEMTGTITDNGGYYFYKNNSLNQWLINPAGAHGVLLQFSGFRLVPGQDTLYIYNGATDQDPLVAALSQDTLPDDILITSTPVLLKFVSDQYNAEAGFSINYNAKNRDIGAVYISTPQGVQACGDSLEIKVLVKNYGYLPVDTVPLKVLIENGTVQVFEKTIISHLNSGQIDTFYLGAYDFSTPGTYTIHVLTQLPGDQETQNDTAVNYFTVNHPQRPPVIVPFDNMTYNELSYSWYDPGYRIWLDYDADTAPTPDTNKYLTAYLNNYDTLHFFYQYRIENITGKTFLRFDYRLQDPQRWPPQPAILDDSSWIAVLVANNCSQIYDTLILIDSTNYIPDSNFVTVILPLNNYSGKGVTVSFAGFWNNGYGYLQLDNFIVADSLANNVLQTYTCNSDNVLVHASQITGGVEPLLYVWQQSYDQHQWITVDTLSSSAGLSLPKPQNTLYLRRIVVDSLGMEDTSNILEIDPQSCIMTMVEVYPNPSDGNIVVTNLVPGRLQIVDMSGRLIVDKEVGYSDEHFSLVGMRPGLYILRHLSSGKVVVKKFVIR